MNRLTSLPALPHTLWRLIVSGNQLTSLPDRLPAALCWLYAQDNRLTSVPENLLTQPSLRLVNLMRNSLSERVQTNLGRAQHAEDYQGPSIIVDVAVAQGPARTLAKAVADWLDGEPETVALWQGFSEEEGAQEYAGFLEKLRTENVNAADEGFRQAVAKDLRRAANNPQLRARYFEVASDANQSCQDRRTLAWNGMQNARIIADIENRVYDNRLGDLIELGRVMFRLDALEGIAREKAHWLRTKNSARRVDEIDVYLGYQVQLRERLGLEHIAPGMAYFNVSDLTAEDIDNAETLVRDKETAEFADYLATDWQPWDTVVSRIAPEAHEAMSEQLIDAMGDEFDDRLKKRLAALNLTGFGDAERELGVEVRKEIEREIRGALRDKVLAGLRPGLQSDRHILPRPDQSNGNVSGAPIRPQRPLVLDAEEWVDDAHISADYALVRAEYPGLAAQARFVEPAQVQLLRETADETVRQELLQEIVRVDQQPNDTADFLFLPVNNGRADQEGDHWSLMFVDRRHRAAYHYDSAGPLNSEAATELATILSVNLLPVRMARQGNNYDCGVFVVDATRGLAARLAQGERPDHEPLHLDGLVADRPALQRRLSQNR
ncbi:hypothetical protein HAP48_0000885 (plasmid) [Bradyrhizobium septentrionale]|uniref:Ubiquitin-like protease family profile domain-containing protein n=1 Tax=Bradyrhizobium septentrionale TaxID=1404411 RepID=A0A974A6N2_9BRAD|nr:NEL-type E3 ubiquitin ligase domain-containing protein [Bradyrhizobium septentrionale]UGY12011.1 hypothetical protein HAP48_0000885 [Bradyrhizobium septentrionale]UGY30215.1 hypothetical protein HU675_0048285 [Bradyrhizobium septentrionale]